MPAMPKEKMNASDYMDRNYFRLLASSQANTAANSPVQSRSSTFSTDTNKPHSIGAQNLNENAFNQGYYSNFFVELNKLGKGFRGSVFLCEHVLDGVKLGKYAIKKVAIGNNHPWLVRMLREVHLLERLRHPNIVSYKHSWLEYNRLTAFGPEVPCLFILMECANGGNLEEYLEFANKPTEQQEQEAQDSSKQKQKKSSKELKRERIRKQYQAQESFEKEHDVLQTQSENKRLLTMTEIWSLFLDIVQGLAHLHQQNIVHRDLKPPNLLLQYDERNSHARQGIPRVLISDFGECEDLDDDQIDNNRTGATGTLEFMAPEHVRLDPRGRNTVDYSPKADMWSLGMVLYFLCYSRLPYSVIDDVDILRTEILSFQEVWFPNSRLDIYKSDKARYTESSNNPSIVNDIPNELKILIRMLLSIDPSKRPSCNEILSKLRSLRRDNNIPFDWPSPTTTTTATKSSSSPVPTASPTASTSKTALPPHLQPFIVEAEEVINSKEDLPFVETNKRSPIHSPEVQHSSTLRKRQRLFGHEEDSDGDVIMSDIEQDTSKTRLLLGSPDLVEASSSSWLTDRQVMLLLKTTTALFKVASCTYSCSPYSTNPAILYPVVFLAMLDFWSESHSPSLILLTLHIIWIMTTTLFSGLCEA
ncbi:hypothetical protein CU098_010703 [Rhizopus stolonifer]|uniref:non-specific serine/threonine protein kinase n=1 Tax=Rhizopus stolonifer TaxID=4846 RepID=A0A367KHV2_RHIST|nr:hypothetical protein CU098_010703 [Rhizopus stolonifer]